MAQNKSGGSVVKYEEFNDDIVVFCDESGAKGYADKSEKEPGEIGVFAGFPIQRAETQDV
jgi:hypothetical protein